MSFPPEVYLIGAQKAGTTTLASILSQHQQICVAKNKEPHYFTHYFSGDSAKDLAWYQEQFSNYENNVCIDASTSYSFGQLSVNNSQYNNQKFRNVPQRIYSINPNAKFIYLVRDPVDRTYSSYLHNLNTGREHQSFGEAIRNDYFYLDISNYYGQLTLWLEYFPLKSFLFLLFEDLKHNPEQVAKQCFEFLEIDSENIQVNLQQHENRTRSINFVGRRFNKIFTELDYSGLGFLAPYLVRRLVHKLTINLGQKVPQMADDERTFLCEYFAEKNHNLANLTGLSLEQWQS
ncbi:sulfotransferase domain-containing protein [Pleurocapsa sp. PCC 7319]|uniref:sulfotransferase domain-containing protein n=1 Tax=Pleurocapsa sp. PCC 7319 TaxID=118161 RepID=UPI0003487F5A|nr:sulfotransferase domain-containing protein [Pleurocapsa sp. PCC 7319]